VEKPESDLHNKLGMFFSIQIYQVSSNNGRLKQGLKTYQKCRTSLDHENQIEIEEGNNLYFFQWNQTTDQRKVQLLHRMEGSRYGEG